MVVDEILAEGRRERRFLAYDCIMLNGQPLTDRPWMVRRPALGLLGLSRVLPGLLAHRRCTARTPPLLHPMHPMHPHIHPHRTDSGPSKRLWWSRARWSATKS